MRNIPFQSAPLMSQIPLSFSYIQHYNIKKLLLDSFYSDAIALLQHMYHEVNILCSSKCNYIQLLLVIVDLFLNRLEIWNLKNWHSYESSRMMMQEKVFHKTVFAFIFFMRKMFFLKWGIEVFKFLFDVKKYVLKYGMNLSMELWISKLSKIPMFKKNINAHFPVEELLLNLYVKHLFRYSWTNSFHWWITTKLACRSYFLSQERHSYSPEGSWSSGFEWVKFNVAQSVCLRIRKLWSYYVIPLRHASSKSNFTYSMQFSSYLFFLSLLRLKKWFRRHMGLWSLNVDYTHAREHIVR